MIRFYLLILTLCWLAPALAKQIPSHSLIAYIDAQAEVLAVLHQNIELYSENHYAGITEPYSAPYSSSRLIPKTGKIQTQFNALHNANTPVATDLHKAQKHFEYLVEEINRLFLAIPGSSSADAQLARVSTAYEDMGVFWAKVFFTWEAHQIPQQTESSSYLERLRGIIQTADKLLQATRNDLGSQVQRLHLQLKQQLYEFRRDERQLHQSLSQNLKGNSAFRIRTVDILESIEKLCFEAQNFQEKKAISSEIKFGNSAYLTYNRKFWPLFYEKNGIYRQLTRILALAEVNMVPPPPRVHWVWKMSHQPTGSARQISVLLDKSGSMAIDGRWAKATSLVPEILKALPHTDQIRLWTWGDEVQEISSIKNRQKETPSFLAEQVPSGDMNFSEVLKPVASEMEQTSQEKHILVISDGAIPIERELVQWLDQQTYKETRIHWAYVGDQDHSKRIEKLARVGKGEFFNLNHQTGIRSFRDWLVTGQP